MADDMHARNWWFAVEARLRAGKPVEPWPIQDRESLNTWVASVFSNATFEEEDRKLKGPDGKA